jgi:hypothetical protein
LTEYLEVLNFFVVIDESFGFLDGIKIHPLDWLPIKGAVLRLALCGNEKIRLVLDFAHEALTILITSNEKVTILGLVYCRVKIGFCH